MPLSVLSSEGDASQIHSPAKMRAVMAFTSNGYKSLLFTFFFFNVLGGICFVSLCQLLSLPLF